MRLRQILEQRRTESTPPAEHACFVLQPDAAVLDLTASDGVDWQFPWQQFTSARHERSTGHDTSVLAFLTHVVTVRGHHLAALREAIHESRLAALRVAPGKYAKAADGEVFITALHVRPVDDAMDKR